MRHFLLSSSLALLLLGTAALTPAHAQWRRWYGSNYYYPSYTTYDSAPSTVYYPPATSAVTVETPVFSAPVATYYPPTTSYYYTPSYSYTPSYYSYPSYYGTYGYYRPWGGWRWR